MQRPKWERCTNGGAPGSRIVVFAPFFEQSLSRSDGGVPYILAPLAEAMPP